MQAAGLRSGTQVVAHQIPVFRPFSVVDGSAGAHGRAAAGTVGDAAEDTVAERGVCPVRLGVLAHEVGGQIEFLLRHQRLVGVLREHPFLLRYFNLLLGFHADLATLAQQRVSQVDPIAKDALYSGVIPQVGHPLCAAFGEVVTALHAILQRRHDTRLVKPYGDTAAGLAGSGHVKNHLDHRRGVLVRHKLVGGTLRFPVAVGWAGHIFAVVAFGVQRLLDLTGRIPQIDIVHGELKRCHQVIFLRVKIAAGCQITDAVFRKIALRIMAGFRHVTAQPGQVFGDDHVDLTGFQMLQHGAETGALEVAAGIAIIGKFFHQNDTVFFAVFPHNGTLVGNTGRFAVLPLLIGKAVIGVCKLNVVPHVSSFPEPLIYGSIIPCGYPAGQNLRTVFR